jgi:hypothetical protein
MLMFIDMVMLKYPFSNDTVVRHRHVAQCIHRKGAHPWRDALGYWQFMHHTRHESIVYLEWGHP